MSQVNKPLKPKLKKFARSELYPSFVNLQADFLGLDRVAEDARAANNKPVAIALCVNFRAALKGA